MLSNLSTHAWNQDPKSRKWIEIWGSTSTVGRLGSVGSRHGQSHDDRVDPRWSTLIYFVQSYLPPNIRMPLKTYPHFSGKTHLLSASTQGPQIQIPPPPPAEHPHATEDLSALQWKTHLLSASMQGPQIQIPPSPPGARDGFKAQLFSHQKRGTIKQSLQGF